MPIPEYYKNMLGITEWQAGMPVYYTKTYQKQVSELPTEQTEQLASVNRTIFLIKLYGRRK